jgi:hypothetical protein
MILMKWNTKKEKKKKKKRKQIEKGIPLSNALRYLGRASLRPKNEESEETHCNAIAHPSSEESLL